jgi:hypothetical protein
MKSTKTTFTLVAAATLASLTRAHFVLQSPASLGYDDAKEIQGPCGGYDAKDRSKGVTDWPVDGMWVSLLSTHQNVKWDISAALVGDGDLQWVPLVGQFGQDGVGTVCFERVPGNPNWVGKDAVVQLVQHAVDGMLHQVRLPPLRWTSSFIVYVPGF